MPLASQVSVQVVFASYGDSASATRQIGHALVDVQLKQRLGTPTLLGLETGVQTRVTKLRSQILRLAKFLLEKKMDMKNFVVLLLVFQEY